MDEVIKNRVFSILANEVDSVSTVDELTLDATLTSLDIDSLAVVCISFAIEDAFGVEIPTEEMFKLNTVGDVVMSLEGLLAD